MLKGTIVNNSGYFYFFYLFMEKQYVTALREGDRLTVKKLYIRNRSAFGGFAKKYDLSEADIADIYQDAFIAIRRHALNGTLAEVSSSFKTYLFGIGKFMIINKIKKDRLYTNILKDSTDAIPTIQVEHEVTMSREQKLVNHYFKKMGKRCQELLTLSFYRGLTNVEISDRLNLANEAVVRVQKSRCLATLRQLVLAHNKKAI